MNAERRKAIGLLYEQVERAKSMLENLDLESIKDEEQESFDNMPEGLQQSEAGQKAEECAGALDEAYCAVEQAVSSLDEALSSLDTCEPTMPAPAKRKEDIA